MEVAQCKQCLKYFASGNYLLAHYKKRHPDYYMTQIKAKEEEILQQELGEIQDRAAVETQKEQFIDRIKEEVVDKYEKQVVGLQESLKKISQQSQNFQIAQDESTAQMRD